jgi:HK97 gp10 family phage protein
VAKVRIKGEEELMRKLRRLPELLEKAERTAVKDETHEMATDIRRGAPVDSGDLRDSTQEELLKHGMTGRAAVTIGYAEFVVHGTSTTPANDFMTPVVNRTRRRFPDRVRDELRDALRKV